MPPEVAELGTLAGNEKEGRAWAELSPACPSGAMPLRQTKIAEGCLQTFPPDVALDETDFIHAGIAVRGEAVAHAVNHKHADAGNGQKAFTRPFENQLRWHHGDRCEAATFRMSIETG